MAITQSSPMRFTPRGLSDAFDATDKFPGACQALTNLVFDPSNPEFVVSKPGTTAFVTFGSPTGPEWGGGELWGGGAMWVNPAPWSVNWVNPGFISLQVSIGKRVYGMIATNRFPGHDEPFAFDRTINDFVPISGVASNNTPASPPTSGDWVPPTLASVGTMLVITHPGFTTDPDALLWGGGALWGDPDHVWSAGPGFYGIIDLTDFDHPSWRSENTAINPLTDIPQAVANFNNRAWFAVKNLLEYTDILTNPLTRTNPSQILTISDHEYINTLSGLPIQTTSGGVEQSLTAFKTGQIWQITGDAITQDLAQNFISINVGTNAPRSVVQVPFGIYFQSTGGPYFLDLLGTLRLVTHSSNSLEPDIVTPFQNAQTATRSAAAYIASVYRVCMPTIMNSVQSTNDYWFDERKRRWTGPHTFPYDCASGTNDGFWILSGADNPGILCKSEPIQTTVFTNADLGQTLQCRLLSATFPKVGDMAIKQVAESQIELSASGGTVAYNITARDAQGSEIGFCQIGVVQPIPTWDDSIVWDDGTVWYMSRLWGGGGLWGALPSFWGENGDYGDRTSYWVDVPGSGLLWGTGTRAIPHTYPCPWTAPLVFEKMELEITAQADAAVAIGTFYARYQRTGYMTFGPPISEGF